MNKVDYVSSIGYDLRKKLNLKGGPTSIITSLCVFDFKDWKIRLTSIHSNSSLQEIIEKTGFKFLIPKIIQITKEPTDKELKFLRNIDKNNEFSKLEKQIVY